MEHPCDVEAYIKKEKEQGVLLGPFDEVPHIDYHCSPMLTRHKGDTRRVTVDL